MIKTICLSEELTAAKRGRKYFHKGLICGAPQAGPIRLGDHYIPDFYVPHPSNEVEIKTTKNRKRAFRIARPAGDLLGLHPVKDSDVRSCVAELLAPELGRAIGRNVADVLTPELIGMIRGLPRFRKNSRSVQRVPAR